MSQVCARFLPGPPARFQPLQRAPYGPYAKDAKICQTALLHPCDQVLSQLRRDPIWLSVYQEWTLPAAVMSHCCRKKMTLQPIDSNSHAIWPAVPWEVGRMSCTGCLMED